MKKPTQHPKNPSQNIWRKSATELVKRELARHQISYPQLEARLQAHGAPYSASYLERRINRGDFSAVLMLEIFKAIEIEEIDVGLIQAIIEEISQQQD